MPGAATPGGDKCLDIDQAPPLTVKVTMLLPSQVASTNFAFKEITFIPHHNQQATSIRGIIKLGFA